MPAQRRLAAAFFLIVALFASNVGLHLWSNRERSAGLEELGHAVSRLALVASLKQRLGDLQKEMGLMAELFEGAAPAAGDAREHALFAEQLAAVDVELADLVALSEDGPAGPAARLQGEAGRLLASWRTARAALEDDRAAAVVELSARADPLAQRVLRERIPELERVERARVAAARESFRRVSRLSQRATVALFLASLLLAGLVARDSARYVAAASRELEGRVLARTHELEGEVEERRTAEGTAARSLSLLQATLESTADGILAVGADGNVVSFNQRFAGMWGIPEEELARGDHEAVFALACRQVKDPAGFATRARQVMADEEAESHDVIEMADGRVFERYSYPQRLGSRVVGRVFSFSDVTERHRVVEALRDSEERYALAARGANDGLWDWDLRARRIFFSPRWAEMLGLEDGEVGQTPRAWFARVHREDRDGLGLEIAAHLEGLTPHFEHAFRMRHRDGGYRWMLARGLAVRDGLGRAYRFAGSLTDVTDRKVAEEQLAHDAFHDALTGLPNRALFMDRLAQACGRAQRHAEETYAVLFLDVDRFKVVNDALGHLSGDQLLVGLARRLERCLRPGDTVARLGGDEFTVLLLDLAGRRDALRVAERIQEEVARPFLLGGQEVFTTASIGIAFGGQGAVPEELLRDADTAMYRAKALGKARYEVFDEAMRERAVAVLRLETSLRRALERHELRVFYQPIVSLRTGRASAVEALLRWDGSERGEVSVPELVAVAEETGLIVPIGRWVLEEACRQMKAWDERLTDGPSLDLSVNLSARQFMQPRLAEQVEAVLAETGVPPERLRLEITESALMQDTDQARDMLRRLRRSGIQVHMDDFGTGYSSMSYLREFRIDGLKIDRTFVRHLEGEGRETRIVRTIVDLAHSLELEVVAEGVETAGQAARLQSLGCEHAQGFFFSPAVPADEVAPLLGATFHWPGPPPPAQDAG